MAATTEAAASGTSARQLTVLCGDKEQSVEDGDFDQTEEASDLYDAVLTGSLNQMKEGPPKVEKPANKEKLTKVQRKALTRIARGGKNNSKAALYIGNLCWWTSDSDIVELASTLGVTDIKDIKFAENGINGQSRGYARVAVYSEESLNILLREIPTLQLNGENLTCCDIRGDVAAFQARAEKRIPLRTYSKTFLETVTKVPTATPKQSPPPIMPPCMPPPPLPNNFSPPYAPFFNHLHPPPPLPYLMPNVPPPSVPPPFPPFPMPLQNDHVARQPPPNLQNNPGFFNPGHDSHRKEEYRHQTPEKTDGFTFCRQHMDKPLNAAIEELINKNKAITSNAITKAISGATSGDLRLAMETLLTAITGIKQSTVYEDPRCQDLVTSLKDCLVSIQANFGPRNSRRPQNRERDWEREDKEDSHEWEAAGMSRRHRERSWSGERGGMRDRDKRRDHRDRYR